MQVGIIFLFAKLQAGDVKVTSRFAVIKKEMVFMLHLVRRQIHEGCSLAKMMFIVGCFFFFFYVCFSLCFGHFSLTIAYFRMLHL